MKFGKRTESPAQQPNPPRAGITLKANGHDVTDKMPLTVAELERQRPNPPREPLPAPEPTSTDPLELGGPIPRSIGRTADLYSDIRALRLTMEKDVEKVKAREHELREHIISNLSKSDDTGASGLRYRAQIVSKDVPRAADWTKIHAYIQKTGRFDLLQKRLGEKAVMDMAEDGKQIPGVEIIKVPEVSITKI